MRPLPPFVNLDSTVRISLCAQCLDVSWTLCASRCAIGVIVENDALDAHETPLLGPQKKHLPSSPVLPVGRLHGRHPALPLTMDAHGHRHRQGSNTPFSPTHWLCVSTTMWGWSGSSCRLTKRADASSRPLLMLETAEAEILDVHRSKGNATGAPGPGGMSGHEARCGPWKNPTGRTVLVR